MSSVLKNPEETHIFAILYPAPGKMQQLKELMAAHINATHKNEDYTPRYLMTEQIEGNEPALHMLETYISRDAAEKHTKTDNFQALIETTTKEGVKAKDPYLVFTETVGGYDWDRQKIDLR